MLLLGLAALASGQLVDDFECPDEFAGFYPHLIRFVFSICLCISSPLPSPLSPPFSFPSVLSPLVVVVVVVDHPDDHLEGPASCK